MTAADAARDVAKRYGFPSRWEDDLDVRNSLARITTILQLYANATQLREMLGNNIYILHFQTLLSRAFCA